MANGDRVATPYAAGGSPTDAMAAIDVGLPTVGGLAAKVQRVTHEVTGAPIPIGVRTIATVGTELGVRAATTLCRKALIQARPANSGPVWVGDSTVDALTGVGLCLFPGDVMAWEGEDLNLTKFDAENAGDGITGVYFP